MLVGLLSSEDSERRRRVVSTNPLGVMIPRHLPEIFRLRFIFGSYLLEHSYKYHPLPRCLISVLEGFAKAFTYSGLSINFALFPSSLIFPIREYHYNKFDDYSFSLDKKNTYKNKEMECPKEQNLAYLMARDTA